MALKGEISWKFSESRGYTSLLCVLHRGVWGSLNFTTSKPLTQTVRYLKRTSNCRMRLTYEPIPLCCGLALQFSYLKTLSDHLLLYARFVNVIPIFTTIRRTISYSYMFILLFTALETTRSLCPRLSSYPQTLWSIYFYRNIFFVSDLWAIRICDLQPHRTHP